MINNRAQQRFEFSWTVFYKPRGLLLCGRGGHTPFSLGRPSGNPVRFANTAECVAETSRKPRVAVVHNSTIWTVILFNFDHIWSHDLKWLAARDSAAFGLHLPICTKR